MVYFKVNDNFPGFQRGSNLWPRDPTLTRGVQLFPGGGGGGGPTFSRVGGGV